MRPIAVTIREAPRESANANSILLCSHADQNLREQLETHLSAPQRRVDFNVE
jgi:hypothetical protein